jgi:hypothetical protein
MASGPSRVVSPAPAGHLTTRCGLGAAISRHPSCMVEAKQEPKMKRTVRIASTIMLLLFVAACDKCGNIQINVPGGTYRACTDANPQG